MKPEYSGYSEIKRWDQLFSATCADPEYFDLVLGVRVNAGSGLLDVGCGSGAFLSWARARCAQLAGVEIQGDLLEADRAFGIEVYRQVPDCPNSSYGVITMFDVLEHIERPDIPEAPNLARLKLKCSGVLSIKVPNCQSPAGLVNQFGDHTHRTTLSSHVVSAHVGLAGFDTISVLPSPDTLRRDATAAVRIAHWLRQLRTRLAIAIHLALWGAGATSLTSNVIVYGTLS